MELTGNPLLDHLEKLFNYLKEHRGIDLTFPQNFSVYAAQDQRVWIKNLELLACSNLIPTKNDCCDPMIQGLLETPEEVKRFLAGGPRPEITG